MSASDEEILDVTPATAAASAARKAPRPSALERHDPNNTVDDNYNDDDYDEGFVMFGSSNSDTFVPTGMLPAYLSEAFGDLFGEDGLVVLGKGLGAVALLATFVRYYGEGHNPHQNEDADSNSNIHSTMDDRKAQPTVKGSDPGNGLPSSLKSNGWVAGKSRPPLVFVLGVQKEGERNALLDLLSSWGTPDDRMPTVITNESGQGKDRAALYRRGGVFVVTSRILIVDLLNHTVNSNDITGFLVSHAEQVTDQSTEAFILRIYHSQKQPFGSGFTKAICRDPDQLLSGFAKVDKVLKALYVRNLYLYPRFHHHVRDELERRPPDVVELHQKLSPLQREMQAALVVAVQSCLRELKSAAPALLQWTDTELSVENCVTTHFDRAISRQLEPEWHRLPPATKQLVQDLRTLRTLFQSMVTYDCVTFYNLLTNLKTASAQTRHPSLWLLTPAANVLFKGAKARCYTVVKPPPPTAKNPHPVGRLVPVLEVNPKWKLLRHVLEEVEREYREQQSEPPQDSRTVLGPTTILVMVQEGRTLDSLQAYLSEERIHQPTPEAAGSGRKDKSSKQAKPPSTTSRSLLLRWLRYLEGINDRSRAKFATTAAASATAETTASKGATSSTTAAPIRTVDGIPEEDRLLLEEEGRVRRILFGTGHGGSGKQQQQRKQSTANSTAKRRDGDAAEAVKGAQSSPTKLNQVPSHIRKRRRIAHEKNRGELSRDDLEREAVLDDAIGATEHELGEVPSDPPREGRVRHRDGESNQGEERPNDDNDNNSADDDDDLRMFRTSYGNELRIVLRSVASIDGDGASLLLQEVRPRYIVMYDSDMSFIRSIEIYSALRDESEPVPRVYFLMFEASAEEKNFMKSLEREQSAFERLIHHKKTMPPPAIQVHASQEMQEALLQGTGGVAGAYMGGLLPLSVDTRRGRGKLDASKERRDVAVDVREFRSALPSILHQGGMRLAPVTLTVGDFVLSNIHCVERKSISDLFGSFASGRLYTQAEAMCKHYKCPCLLIEFDPQKSFSLQSASELGSEIRTDSICSKMALLVMHFPKLRILWSKSPHETLRIFRDLKVNHDEVDVARAVEVGQSESIEALLSPSKLLGRTADGGGGVENVDMVMDEVNEAARDTLLRLPGVNVPIARRIMQECDSLSDLVEMSRDDLRKLAGPNVGQRLFTFFRQKLDPSAT